MTARDEGLRQIETAQWKKDEYGYLNLHVHTPDGYPVQAWLSLRPGYCDRGHIQLNIDGPLNLDGADSFPRFFFSFREADEHTRTFLKWRLWKERTHPHVLEVPLPPAAKRCSKCTEHKPLDDFHLCRTGTQGRAHWCKECYRLYALERSAERVAEREARARLRENR